MKLGIMQPYFFPYLGYWQLINAVDTYVVYDDVAFIKGGWISRNNILLNGQKHLITLPLEGASSFKKINEIPVTHNLKQREKVLLTIEQAYKRAPFFHVIFPILQSLIFDHEKISTMNFLTIKKITEYLEINTEIILSSNIKKNNTLKGEDKVIHINQLLGSDEYYNAIGGKNLYRSESFEEKGISLFFLKTGQVSYNQFDYKFVPDLSIIDVMMFNAVDKIRQMLNQYTLLQGE